MSQFVLRVSAVFLMLSLIVLAGCPDKPPPPTTTLGLSAAR
jgi:hypothetical protein